MSKLGSLTVTRCSVVIPKCVRNNSGTVSTEKDYFKRNEALKRPVSPSVGILSRNPDSVWVLSFMHRATGFALTGGVSVAAISYLVSSKTFPQIMDSVQGMSLNPILVTELKFLMAFPLTYHFFNGIRHLLWDTGRGFQMKTVYRAGYTVLTLGALTALGLALYRPA